MLCPWQLRQKVANTLDIISQYANPPTSPRHTRYWLYLFSCLSPTQFWLQSQKFRVLAKSRNLRPRNLDFILEAVGCIQGLWVASEISKAIVEKMARLGPWRMKQKSKADNCGNSQRELLPMGEGFCSSPNEMTVTEETKEMNHGSPSLVPLSEVESCIRETQNQTKGNNSIFNSLHISTI